MQMTRTHVNIYLFTFLRFHFMLLYFSCFKLASSQTLDIEVTGFSSLHEICDCFSKSSFDFTFFSALQDSSAWLWIFFYLIGKLELQTFLEVSMKKLALSNICRSGWFWTGFLGFELALPLHFLECSLTFLFNETLT